MAFLFCDSMEGYNSRIDMNERGWELATGSTTGQISQTVMLDDTRSFAPTVGITNKQFQGTGLTVPDIMWISFWFRYGHDASNLGSVIEWIIDTGSTRQWKLALNTDETLQFYDNVTPVGLKSESLIRDKWYHIEVKFRHNASISAGDCEVRVDGVTYCTLDAGTDTSNIAGTGKVQGFGIVANSSGVQYYDSIVVWGDDVVAGDNFNTWMGRLRIGAIHPNGNGNTSDLTGSDGNSVDNYLLVDEVGLHDGDTTYVESSTLNEKDTWQYENISGSIVSIPLVQIVTVAKKTDVGDRRITPLVRTGGSDYQNATEHLLVQDTYNTYMANWQANPNTTSAWTESEINAAEFGLEVTT